MHSVTYIYMLHTLYYTQIPSWYYQRMNACSSFLTWNIWAAFTVSLLKLLKLWTFHCTPIRGPSIPCTLDSLNHQTEYISSCLFPNYYGHDVVHVQGTLCSWVHSNQLGPHAAPLKWLRMWPIQPSSLFRHNVYSFCRWCLRGVKCTLYNVHCTVCRFHTTNRLKQCKAYQEQLSHSLGRQLPFSTSIHSDQVRSCTSWKKTSIFNSQLFTTK